jgi:hypothetical protein
MNYLQSANEPKPLSATFPRYSIWTLLRTMAVLALGYVLLLAYLHYQGDSDIRRIFGGTQGLSVFNHADRIEAYRVETPADLDSSSIALETFSIIKGPIAISQSDAQPLLATLQDRNSYLWDVRKGCKLIPGVRLDFIRGDDRLSVLLCFECDMLVNYLNGKVVGGGNTDKVRPTLVRVARSLFPDDAKIQSLSEQQPTPAPGG